MGSKSPISEAEQLQNSVSASACGVFQDLRARGLYRGRRPRALKQVLERTLRASRLTTSQPSRVYPLSGEGRYMKTKLLTLILLAGSTSLAHAGVLIGARFGVGYYGCYGCGYYGPRRAVLAYLPAWYPRHYWRAAYWGRPAYVGAYWMATPPQPVAPIVYGLASPPPACLPMVPATPQPAHCPAPAVHKTAVRKHSRAVSHAKKSPPPCKATSG